MQNIAIAPDNDLLGATTEQLREELVRTLGLTASNLARMAQIVRVLEERGEDLEALHIGLLHHLRRIAYGQVLPEVVVRFAGRPFLIKVIGNLPIPDQCRIAAGEPVAMATTDPVGVTTHRMVDPYIMTPGQAAQVFAADHIRDLSEQAVILDQKRSRKSARMPDRIGQLRIDKERGGVMVGRYFVPQVDLAAALSILKR